MLNELCAFQSMQGLQLFCLQWHPKLNQVVVACGDRKEGSVHVLYDTQLSSRGALLCVGRQPRLENPGDLQINVRRLVQSGCFDLASHVVPVSCTHVSPPTCFLYNVTPLLLFCSCFSATCRRLLPRSITPMLFRCTVSNGLGKERGRLLRMLLGLASHSSRTRARQQVGGREIPGEM